MSVDYDEFQEDLRRKKRALWARIIASEPGRAAGRRPRDPEQERLLLQIDRARLAKREADGRVRVRRVDADESKVRGPS